MAPHKLLTSVQRYYGERIQPYGATDAYTHHRRVKLCTK